MGFYNPDKWSYNPTYNSEVVGAYFDGKPWASR